MASASLAFCMRLVGYRGAVGVDGGAADMVVGDVERDHPAAVHPVDDATDLTHDLGADAVTGQYQKLLVGGHRGVLAVQRGPVREMSTREARSDIPV